MNKLEHVSASQIKTFKDCQRKWYYQKIVGLPSPSTQATEKGKELHRIIEDYLKDQIEIPNSELGNLAKKGIPFLPEPSCSLSIEIAVHEHLPIRNLSVPLVGYIDILERGDGYVRILDHKTTSSKKYMKTALELSFDIQMLVYAKAVFENIAVDSVELVHVYYGTKAPFWADRVSVQVSREQCEIAFEDISKTIDKMKENATKDIKEIPRNLESCAKFGGCPYHDTCISLKAYKQEQAPLSPSEENMTFTKKLGLIAPGAQAPITQAPITQAPVQPVQEKPIMKFLYVGCLPQKGASQPITFYEAFGEPIKAICRGLNVSHLSQVDYGKGWNAFQAFLNDHGWPPSHPSIYIDPMSDEYTRVGSMLIALADIVIRRS